MMRLHEARTVRRSLLVVVAALVAALGVVAGPMAGVARAHGDDGEMELTRLVQLGVDQIDLEVGIVYANDGHQAEDATVTAIFTGPEGATVGPVPLDQLREGAALYLTTVQVPVAGTWTVTVTSEDPSAEVTGEVTIDPTENEPPSTTTTIPPTSTTLTEAEETAIEGALTDTDDEGGLGVIALVAAGVVLASIGGAVLLGRNRGPGRGDSSA